MAKENNNLENPTPPVAVAVKKDNTLPIIAVSLAGSALLISLFTAGSGVASATPEHRPDRDREHSQVMEHERAYMNEGKQYGMEEHEGMPERERKMNEEQSMPQMGEKQNQHRMGEQAPLPNTMTGAS